MSEVDTSFVMCASCEPIWRVRSLEGLDPGGSGPWRVWTLEGLDPGGSGPWRVWTLEGLDPGGSLQYNMYPLWRPCSMLLGGCRPGEATNEGGEAGGK